MDDDDEVKVPPELEEESKRVAKEVEEMLVAIKAEHGEAFGDAVRSLMAVRQVVMILTITGAPDGLLQVHTHLMSGVLRTLFKALGVTDQVKQIEQHSAHVLDRMGQGGGLLWSGDDKPPVH